MRLLPILIEGDPGQTGWETLSAARKAVGYTDQVKPARALPGSPQPILAVGQAPSWLTDYAHVGSLQPGEAMNAAMEYALDDHSPAEVGQRYAELLSSWMGAEVKYTGEEEHDSGVQFT